MHGVVLTLCTQFPPILSPSERPTSPNAAMALGALSIFSVVCISLTSPEIQPDVQ